MARPNTHLGGQRRCRRVRFPRRTDTPFQPFAPVKRARYGGTMIKVYQYPKCGTCRKALKWLDAHGVEYKAVDIVESPPARKELAGLVKRAGLPLRKWFNTSGQSYRQGGFKEKLESMSDAQAMDALAADGKLIKRPVLVDAERVLLGFDEGAYRALAK